MLAFIKEKKDVLFGKFTSELDKNRKTSAWKDALIKAQSLQIVASTRDWTYLRDNVFGVWKTRAMVRIVVDMHTHTHTNIYNLHT